jgi:hypothetical protein
MPPVAEAGQLLAAGEVGDQSPEMGIIRKQVAEHLTKLDAVRWIELSARGVDEVIDGLLGRQATGRDLGGQRVHAMEPSRGAAALGLCGLGGAGCRLTATGAVRSGGAVGRLVGRPLGARWVDAGRSLGTNSAGAADAGHGFSNCMTKLDDSTRF